MADATGSAGHRRVPIEPQSVDAPLTTSAVFLVLSLTEKRGAIDVLRSVLRDLSDLAKTVAIRDLSADLTCTVAICAEIWPALTRWRLPAQLRPFEPVHGESHTAPATPGDVLFHIRSNRRDLCFEFERLLLDRLGDAVSVDDETAGFRYFDTRDLLGFVDGTANPVGVHLPAATLVADEDPDYAGGSYIVVQKYLHDIDSWQRLRTDQQEAIIGRTKVDNIELDDAETGQKSHKTLTTIVDADGTEHDILRDNMPFGSPGSGEFGTYFIGYGRELWVIQRMLERMFVGDPPGLHDRLLDFSTAVTGGTFFAPPVSLVERLGDADIVPAQVPAGRDGEGHRSSGPDGNVRRSS